MHQKLTIVCLVVGISLFVVFSTAAFTGEDEITAFEDGHGEIILESTTSDNADNYLEDDNGDLAVNITALNRNAETDVDDLFRITNERNESAGVYIQHEADEEVRFREMGTYDWMDSLENSIVLEPDESIDVGVFIDTYGVDSIEGDTMTITLGLPPANFTYEIDAPDEVFEGDSFTVEGIIENEGGLGDVQNVTMTVDDTVVYDGPVELSAGESETIAETVEAPVDAEELTIELYSNEKNTTHTVDIVADPSEYIEHSIRSPDTVTGGEDYEITATVSNTADETLTEDVSIIVDGEVVEERSLVLMPGSSVSVTETVQAPYVSEETAIDIELAGDNGQASTTTTVVPDEALSVNLVDSPDVVVAGSEYELEGEIYNVGNTTIGESVALTAGDETVANEDVILQPGESANISTVQTAVETETIVEQYTEVAAGNETDSEWIEIVPADTLLYDVSVPDEVVTGELFTLELDATNPDDVAVSETVDIVMDDESVVAMSVTVDGNDTQQFTATLRAPDETGTVPVEAIGEADSAEDELTVIDPLVTDLDAQLYAPEEVVVDTEYAVTGEVKNVGQDAVTLDLELRDVGWEEYMETVTIRPDETITMHRTLQAPDFETVRTIQFQSEVFELERDVLVSDEIDFDEGVDEALDLSLDVPELVETSSTYPATATIENPTDQDIHTEYDLIVDGDRYKSGDMILEAGEIESITTTVVSPEIDRDQAVSAVANNATANATVGVEQDFTERFDAFDCRIEPDRLTVQNGETLATFSQTTIQNIVFPRVLPEVDLWIESCWEIPEHWPEPPGPVVSMTQVGIKEDAGLNATFQKGYPMDRLDMVGVDAEDLVVYRFVDGDWVALETELLQETDDWVRTEAETDGFPYFVTVAVELPTPVIDAPDQPIEPGTDATFDGSNSTSKYGNITDYQWRINGEEFTGEMTDVEFTSEGTFTVRLTVVNDYGLANSTQVEVVVGEPADWAATHEEDDSLWTVGFALIPGYVFIPLLLFLIVAILAYMLARYQQEQSG